MTPEIMRPPFRIGEPLPMERLLVCKKGLKELGIPYSYAHIWRLEKEGKFPKRVQLGACRVAWIYKEVCDWVAGRVAARDT